MADNRANLNSIRAKLDELVGQERDAAELRTQLYDSVSRNRMRPGDLSDAYIISLLQKLNQLADRYDRLSEMTLDISGQAFQLEKRG